MRDGEITKSKGGEITLNFFMPMKKIPTTTHQQKQVHVVKGKPIFYEPNDLRQARMTLMDNLARFCPPKPIEGMVKLGVKWQFPLKNHEENEYKTTKPDLDNLVKLLQDCMTQLGFWEDDRYVVSLHTEKTYNELSGIYIQIEGDEGGLA